MTTLDKICTASQDIAYAAYATAHGDPAHSHMRLLAAIAWLTDAVTDFEAPTPPDPDPWVIEPGKAPRLAIETYDYTFTPTNPVHRN